MDKSGCNFFRDAFSEGSGETLAVAYLARDSTPLGSDIFCDNQRNSVRLPLRKIASTALRLDAKAMIITHHHPGDAEGPSIADIAATRSLAKLCRDLDIELRDHIILANAKHFSFREKGLL